MAGFSRHQDDVKESMKKVVKEVGKGGQEGQLVVKQLVVLKQAPSLCYCIM